MYLVIQMAKYIFLIYIWCLSTLPGSQLSEPLKLPERLEQWDKIWSLVLSS